MPKMVRRMAPEEPRIASRHPERFGVLKEAYWGHEDIPEGEIPETLTDVLGVFAAEWDRIRTPERALPQEEVLEHLRPGLRALGFRVEDPEVGETVAAYGAKPDAYHDGLDILFELEDSATVANHKPEAAFFKAVAMAAPQYLVVAVPNRLERFFGHPYDAYPYHAVETRFGACFEQGLYAPNLLGVLLIGF